MLLDGLLPRCDATRAEHRVIPGTMDAVYDAVRDADFMEAWRGSPAPSSMRLADMPRHGEWVLLGHDPPREIAFIGVILRAQLGVVAATAPETGQP